MAEVVQGSQVPPATGDKEKDKGKSKDSPDAAGDSIEARRLQAESDARANAHKTAEGKAVAVIDDEEIGQPARGLTTDGTRNHTVEGGRFWIPNPNGQGHRLVNCDGHLIGMSKAPQKS